MWFVLSRMCKVDKILKRLRVIKKLNFPTCETKILHYILHKEACNPNDSDKVNLNFYHQKYVFSSSGFRLT